MFVRWAIGGAVLWGYVGYYCRGRLFERASELVLCFVFLVTRLGIALGLFGESLFFCYFY